MANARTKRANAPKTIRNLALSLATLHGDGPLAEDCVDRAKAFLDFLTKSGSGPIPRRALELAAKNACCANTKDVVALARTYLAFLGGGR